MNLRFESTRAPPPDALRRGLERNLSRTLVLGFFQVFLVFMPVAVPFFQSRGLSMQEVFSLQALFGLVVLVTEVPSGYLADLLGRRRTLVIGSVFAGIGHSLLAVADGFWGLACFEIALGISMSLISGADLALLYDSEAALERGEAQQRQVVGRLYAARTASEAVAALVCSGVLLLATMNELILLQALVGWLPLFFALGLTEPPVERLPAINHWANLQRICGHMVNHSRVLRLTLLALSIWSLTTFYAVWLLQKLWEQQAIPLAAFGVLWAALCLLAAAAGRYATQAERRLGTTGLLVLIGLAPALGYVGLDLFGTVGAFVAATTFFVARGFGLVVLRDALNSRVPGEFRATANSLASFGFRGAFVLTGPWVGHLLDVEGMSTVLQLLAVMTLLIFLALLLPLALAVRSARRPEAGATVAE